MMISRLATAASVIPLTALMLSACVSQSSYDALQAQNQQLQAQNQQFQAQVSGLQREASFVEAGDLLFPEGGYQLSAAGKAELSNNIVPKLTGLQNAKVVVYGYTDNLPVGAPLQRAGINDNLTLSSRRAGDVVTCRKDRQQAPPALLPSPQLAGDEMPSSRSVHHPRGFW